MMQDLQAMNMLNRLWTHFNPKSLVAVAFCGGLASLLSLLLRGDPIGYVLPLIFLLVVIPIAHLWGTLSGILAAIIAGVAFAVTLFPPFGSLAVRGTVDRMTLLAFELIAVGIAYLSSPTVRT
jgi:K+-sensing histidine kinase KdpD